MVSLRRRPPASSGADSPASKKRKSGGSNAADKLASSIQQKSEDTIKKLRSELTETYKHHDDLLRLLFHLDHFITLVGYDSNVARSDNSEAFQQYRVPYDLWDSVATHKSGGKSRPTRRQLLEQKSLLLLDEPASSSSRATATPKKQLPKPQKKSKDRIKRKEQIHSDRSENDSDFDSDDSSDNSIFEALEDDYVPQSPEPMPNDKLEELGFNVSDKNFKWPSLSVKYTIKEPVVFHPMNIPVSNFNRSVEDYLNSFVSYENDDVTPEVHAARVEKERELRARIRHMQETIYISKGYDFSTSQSKRPFTPQLAPSTHRDYLNAHAIHFAKLMLEEKRQHIGTARKVSAMIQNHFKRIQGAEERQRKLEEKRILKLAKWTAQEVKKKWRLAEKVVMQKQRKKLEEEQKEAGREQLKQMLAHSSQLLEAQQETPRQSVTLSDEPMSDLSESDELNLSSSEESEDQEDEVDDTDQVDDSLLTAEELKQKYNEVLDSEVNNSFANTSDIDLKASSDESERIEVGLNGFYDESMAHSSDSEGADFSSEESDSDDENISDSDASSSGKSVSDANEGKPETNGISKDHGNTLSSLYGHFSGSASDSTASVTESNSDLDSEANISEDDIESAEVSVTTPESETGQADSGEDDSGGPKVQVPFLLRGTLRKYQYEGLRWLVGLYNSNTNGILADEMGLGKTIQTIALIAYLACYKQIWGPHLIVVPTSVMLNWEMEFKRFCPGLKILTYYGNPQQRKEKRKGWNKPDSWHVCITSYQLVIQDQPAFRRKQWSYLILDEAHNIKNFRSQRWQALLNFKTDHRLLLTGTPLQNNLIELWSLLYFLMPATSEGSKAQVSAGFASLTDFQEWFGRPVDRLIEDETVDIDAKNTIAKLHQILRPYLLRRIKADVEKQMPAKYEHIVFCRLSKRQRYLYDEFMSRTKTRETLASGNYMSIINCLMQLRKVCNHPDLFEVRPIVTSYVLSDSALKNEISKVKVSKKLVEKQPESLVNLDFLGLKMNFSRIGTLQCAERIRLSANEFLLKEYKQRLSACEKITENVEDLGTIKGQRLHIGKMRQSELAQRAFQEWYVNIHRTSEISLTPDDVLRSVKVLRAEESLCAMEFCDLPPLVRTLDQEIEFFKPIVDKFLCITPAVVSLDTSDYIGSSLGSETIENARQIPNPLHFAQVKSSIAFPDKQLLQYDCGKLQKLYLLLRDLIAEGHRALIFTQMTRVLDILEQFLNMHGWRYMRLDGATKIEHRQLLTERFNQDSRIPVFILSSRSGGLGINLTGADTVIFYDSDWNPAMDKQCQDRSHRIGQTRDVHIYRLVSEYTIESNILRKANQKRMLDNVVIQDGEFTTDYFSKISLQDMFGDEVQLGDSSNSKPVLGEADIQKALAQAEDAQDAAAAKLAQKESNVDTVDFENERSRHSSVEASRATSESYDASSANQSDDARNERSQSLTRNAGDSFAEIASGEGQYRNGIDEHNDNEENNDNYDDDDEEDEDIGDVDDYMISFIEKGYYE
ncbi:hypothetical protein CANCADRAFT_121715 [Tortispora caseinolytica NRRL Y-17796]|uniref:Helicase SWR1 n=1 Tax=Tortispora caseinolytica NRRL Y-17796 TaxID=767744 RepID=A0A1E4THK7_9ASCO|nr:hypothetical protein CANCADRAFT_121715 [Tortispora caseinolytica NRRL Y-17796]